MKILAIDTSSEICSVALLEEQFVIDEINLENGKTHSENLIPIIDEILKRNNLKISNINLLACCVGPGSFTGIRIGVSTIKPIAEVLNLKIASVTSLETLAHNINEKSKIIVSLIDARNNNVYCGIFNDKYERIQEYMVDDINIILSELKKFDNIVFVGNGSEKHKNLLIKELTNISFSNNNKQLAVNVGKIGYKKFKDNNLCTADNIIPIYLRKSQAERIKQEKENDYNRKNDN